MMPEAQKTSLVTLESTYEEMKKTIAKSDFFITADRPRPTNLIKICSSTETNRKCGDSVTMEAYFPRLHCSVDSQTFPALFPMLYYSGTFCAVCHFSAELICQSVYAAMNEEQIARVAETDFHVFKDHLERSVHCAIKILSSLETEHFEETEQSLNPAFEKLFSLNRALLKMPSRKLCALLPWQAALKLNDMLSKNRNVPT